MQHGGADNEKTREKVLRVWFIESRPEGTRTLSVALYIASCQHSCHVAAVASKRACRSVLFSVHRDLNGTTQTQQSSAQHALVTTDGLPLLVPIPASVSDRRTSVTVPTMQACRMAAFRNLAAGRR